jgi:hypothetical protein
MQYYGAMKMLEKLFGAKDTGQLRPLIGKVGT